jgi:hypothetical protein
MNFYKIFKDWIFSWLNFNFQTPSGNLNLKFPVADAFIPHNQAFRNFRNKLKANINLG